MARPNQIDDLIARERRRVKTTVAERGLCGLANDTKWDEFFSAMRAHDWAANWVPKFRSKCVDSSPSKWDFDWWNIPAVMASLEWLDIAYIQKLSDNRLPKNTRRIDHSPWIGKVLIKVGLEYRKGTEMIRIFGYSPKDLSQFDT